MPRQTIIQLTYNNKDITRDIARFLTGFTYTDNASGQADDLQISLENRDNLWTGDWLPEKGDAIEATIIAKGFRSVDSEDVLPCGFFEIDELEAAGAPDTVTIKAISAPVSTALRGEQNSRAWENICLKNIAKDMANKAEMSLQYLAEYNPNIKRQDQAEQSDLAFLQQLCDRAGLSLKVTDDKIVIFDEEEMEKTDPVATITKGVSNIISYKFSSKTRDIYRACQISYNDARTGQKFKYLYEPPNAPETGQLLKINEQVDSPEEGAILARKRLREKNVKENMAGLTLVGNARLVSGVIILVKGFQKFDGKYYITRATHAHGSSGYTTTLEMHKTMESYLVNLSNTIVTSKPKKARRKKSKTQKENRWAKYAN